MKILVYGAGVLGSIYAVRLFQTGNEVTILARGERYAQIQKNGIVLECINRKTFTSVFVPVVQALAPEDEYDLIVVILRRNQIDSILPILAANQKTPNILFLGNNVRGIPKIVAELGKERVLMGFAVFGGLREGGVVRYMLPFRQKEMGYTVVGELDGKVTARLQEIVKAFKGTGLPVKIEPNIDAWLKTHFALVGPVAGALYMAGGDNYRLANTRDGLILMIRGIKEGFKVLKVLGIPIVPESFRNLARIPEPFLVAILKRMFATQMAEVFLAGHANAARDEMSFLIQEFRELIRLSGLPTPNLDRLFSYVNPEEPPLPQGSANLRMNWKPVWAAAAALVGLLGIGALLGSRFFAKRPPHKG